MMVILWPIMGLCVVISAFFAGYAQGVKDGEQVIRAEWDTEKATIITAQREKEAGLQAGMDQLRKEKNRETAKLQRTVAALTDSLRNRPERPAVPSASTGDGAPGCTGAELYREDAALVISESERAEIIRLALIQCQGIYRAASGQ